MRPDRDGGPAGPIITINEEIDRYMNDFTVNYVMNGQQYSVTFKMPNSAAKKVFDWDPNQPIPFYPSFGYDRANNPTEFENAMVNLGDILSNPDYEVMAQRITNRNVDITNFDATEELLIALGQSPLTVDDLYPAGIKTEMTDFSSSQSNFGAMSSTFPPSTYKSTTTLDPPMEDATIRTNGSWGHTYKATMSEDGVTPNMVLSGMSDNVEYSTIVKPTGDRTYDVTVVLKTGDQETTENINIDLAGTVGIDDLLTSTTSEQNFPNPFYGSTSLKYGLKETTDLTINIYDMKGSLVRTLVDEQQTPGEYTVKWDGKSKNGAEVSQGLYFFNFRNKEGMLKTVKALKLD